MELTEEQKEFLQKIANKASELCAEEIRKANVKMDLIISKLNEFRMRIR